MPRSREGLLSAIRAMSEMTEARGCTQAEAKTARVKAFELMYKHRINMRDLMTPRYPTVPQVPLTPEPSRRAAYDHWEEYRIYPNDAFAKRTFSRKPSDGGAVTGGAVFVVGCGITALAVWVIATFSAGWVNQPSSAREQIAKLAEARDELQAIPANRWIPPR